jgi:hypothetical protein
MHVVHLEKHCLQSNSTDRGTISDVKQLSVNADSSIRCNFESDSNVFDVSDLQLEKHCLQSISTDRGTINDVKQLP